MLSKACPINISSYPDIIDAELLLFNPLSRPMAVPHLQQAGHCVWRPRSKALWSTCAVKPEMHDTSGSVGLAEKKKESSSTFGNFGLLTLEQYISG
jgi:hypothetical protein